jgi:hypothetical protein
VTLLLGTRRAGALVQGLHAPCLVLWKVSRGRPQHQPPESSSAGGAKLLHELLSPLV